MHRSDRVSCLTRHVSCGVLVLAAVLGTTAAQAADDAKFVPGKDGWITLFDGSEKGRWTPTKKGGWQLERGAAFGQEGELFNDWEWADFELMALCRGAGAVRCRVSSEDPPKQAGYAIDIADGTIRSGGRVVAKGRAAKSDAWRPVRVTVTGDALTVHIGGRKAAECKDGSCPKQGRIALAPNGGTLEVKLVRIRPLGRAAAKPETGDKVCLECHDDFEKEKLARKHRAKGSTISSAVKQWWQEDAEWGSTRRGKRPKPSGCIGCHGPSAVHRADEDGVTAPDILYTRAEVDATCLHCHKRHKRERKRDNGIRTRPPANPVCTDCHGRHHVSD